MRISGIVALTASTLAALCLCACTDVAGVAPDDSVADSAGTPVMAAVGPVSAVTVTFSDQAQQLAGSDPRLSPDAVAMAVEHELQLHQMYAPAAANVRRTLAITVQNFTSSLASDTKLLGYSFHNVMLNGTVQVQGAAAAETPPFDVHARVRISTRNSSAAGGSLAPLYTQFGVLTVAVLRGGVPPPQ